MARTVAMNDDTSNPNQDASQSVITGVSSPSTLTNVDNTIVGVGLIGGGDLTLVNDAGGSIIAQGPTPLTLNTGANTIANAGLIESINGMFVKGDGIHTTILNSGLIELNFATSFSNAIVDNNAGMIESGNFGGANVSIVNSTIIGGLLLNGEGCVMSIASYSGVSSFDTTILDNRGLLEITSFSALTIEGIIKNSGEISLGGFSAPADLNLGGNVTLEGGGQVILSDGSANKVSGLASGDTLTNVDNAILGAGEIGGRQMTLVNEAAGKIKATGTNPLDVDTGANTITNAGMIKTTGSGGLALGSSGTPNTIDSNGVISVKNGSVLTVFGSVVGSGQARINGGTLNFMSGFTENVTFIGATGTLELAQSQSYTGVVSNFSKTGGTSIDLGDISFVSSGEASYSGTAGGALRPSRMGPTRPVSVCRAIIWVPPSWRPATAMAASSFMTRQASPPRCKDAS